MGTGTSEPSDSGPPQSLKVGHQDPLQNLKVGPQDPLQSLKAGPSHLSLMNSFFLEYFFAFFTCLFLHRLNKTHKNINCEEQKSKVNTNDKQVYVTTKKLSEETEQNPSEPHSLAVLFKVYL